MFKYSLIFITFFLTLYTSAIQAKKIPLSSFNQMPMVQQPSISPDGKNIAVIINRDDETQVAISPFNNPSQVVPVVGLSGEKYRIESINWANNERVLVTVTQPIKYLFYRLRTTHIYSVKIDGSNTFELSKKQRVKDNLDAYRSSPHLLSILEQDPNHILVTVRDWRDNYYSSVFKVNIVDGTFTKYLPNGLKINSWQVNKSGEILMAMGTDDNEKTDFSYIYIRKNNESDWELAKKREAYKEATFSPVLYEQDTNSIVVISNRELNKNALWRYHISTEEFELLGEAPGNYDIDGSISKFSGDKRNVVGFTYTDNFVQRVYFDEKNEALNQQITSIFSKQGLKAYLYDWDKAANKYIIYGVSDDKPGQFFLFDREKKKISKWFGQYPSLSKEKLSPVKPIEFKAQDGMTLYGYLTMPEGVENPPLILHPHGGPYGVRDTQYFDPFVQLFASRGYAVLQVNYRGSGGFGNEYLASGYSQWGKKMQSDLVDAMNWIKAKDIVDTKNSCIVGASYGGYAALTAGYQTPDLFNCIVSIAGISDMDDQVVQWKYFGYQSYIDNAVNGEENDLDLISPVHYADKFKAPVLLIHGKVDMSVNYRQSEGMFKALKKAKKDVEFKLFDYGTHYLNDATNRKEAMGLMIEFIDEHIN
ncbi:prolyl oligopeptidase family serine peptidase [Psychrosphaera aquimarina]|uniref:Prolyl oligopeptidase family serine peptidase n=1 Tax=Psychrosphaera aquimarina TaxID=2044854 RepID=A0ABU3QZ95_9GAMM|nr:alpha/beta fold hydrolase [Psychrosphaera aquimarina]MDU0112756.1 prolyl oligopeptidase family serine peptidase [Psychrosphaera aquimarina]